MFSLEIECSGGQQEMLVAELWEQGSVGILELDGGRLRAFFDDGSDRAALAALFHAVSWREEEDRDWVAMSRANWEPIEAGERFYLVPQWRDDPAPAGRFRIVVNPGMAFGTGVHETTRLCLEALERHVRAGVPMLDVGTGSGILAQAAALLGAAPVWACDIDPVAVEIARAAAGGASYFVGSVDAVASGSAGLIVANISPEAVTQLAGELLRCLSPDGIALLSGFEREETAAVRGAIERHGGTVRETRYKENWALVAVASKTHPTVASSANSKNSPHR
jgi:ribosomal protein L11 methyltransferase